MGGIGDVTNGAVVNKVNSIRLECRPPETVGDELDSGSDTWIT